MDRRSFLKKSSSAVVGSSFIGLGATTEALAAKKIAPSDQVRFGVIGVGSRGKAMMRRFLRVPGVSIGALCDVYEPSLAEGREITGEATPAFDDYARMLDEVRDLDAVLVATPLNSHAEHMTAALDHGLHVYGEKALGFTVDDCNAIVDAVRRSGQLFQIGQQWRYSPWYREAIERIHNGEIGQVSHVYGFWHRNYNWRRNVPEPSLERLINWRLYREYSGGLLAELGSHQIDIANWVYGEMPEVVMGSGGIDFYHDGRETFDNVQAIFTYPSGGTFVFSSLIGNHKVGYQIQIFGTGGTVELTLADGTLFYEPARERSAVPKELVERGIYTTPTLSTQGDMPYRGAGLPIEIPEGPAGEPTYQAAASFIESIRQNERPFADELVGWRTAVPVALGNRAIQGQDRIDFADHVEAP
jgi:predicted dehydrogenase